MEHVGQGKATKGETFLLHVKWLSVVDVRNTEVLLYLLNKAIDFRQEDRQCIY